MDLPIRIFCEGTSDQRFLRDFLKVHYNFDISDNDLANNKYIENMGSWNKLFLQENKITESFSEYVSLIFLDADDEKVTDKPGFEATNIYINDLMKSWNWTKYDTFVLPNNEDSGTVEDLLENVINKTNSLIFECWNQFETCLSKNLLLTIPAKKSKIYSYLECLHGVTNKEKEKCKDAFRDFQNENLWEIRNLENRYISKLKEFLDQYLK